MKGFKILHIVTLLCIYSEHFVRSNFPGSISCQNLSLSLLESKGTHLITFEYKRNRGQMLSIHKFFYFLKCIVETVSGSVMSSLHVANFYSILINQ